MSPSAAAPTPPTLVRAPKLSSLLLRELLLKLRVELRRSSRHVQRLAIDLVVGLFSQRADEAVARARKILLRRVAVREEEALGG